MKNPMRFMRLMLLPAIGMLFACTLGVASESDEEILIGRIAHIEGKLLRYIEENKDWVHTVKDSPFGLDDTLYSGEDAKAEMIMPNKTWLRVGENTQIQLINLNTDATTLDVAAGLARLYNKSDDGVIKVTTPFGYVVAPAGTVFDLYVGDESLEVIAVRGNVDFVHENSRARYEVWEGSSSLIADSKETAQGNGMVDSDWDDWNDNREALWTKRLQNQSTSMDLLPEPIRDQSYVLEENGQWERVHYEGAYRDMWRPTRIDPGWRPFTTGRWTVYYGDNCWIPDEPFGYVTHHYGSWVYIESFAGWYWMPPVARFNAGQPGLSISFAWFPGRVGWLHSGPSIGWVPLTPGEVYYGHRRWGRRTVVINSTTVVNINIGRYRYIDEAVIIDRDYFYRGSRYTPHIQQNIGRDVIINNYRPTTVINNTIINNITIDKRRYTYNDAEVSRKPHTTVINRINDNHKAKQDFGPGNRERIKKDLMRVQAKAEPSPKVELHKPQLSTKLVGSDDIAKPFNALHQERKLIKPNERERSVSKEKDQQFGPKGKEEPGQKGRSLNAEDGAKQLLDESQAKTSLQDRERRRRPGDQPRQDEPGDADNTKKDLQQRLKSPREKQNQGPEILSPPPTKIQKQEEESQRLDNGLKKRQEQLQQQQQIPVPRGDKEQRRPQNLGETGEARDITTPEDKPRLKSPRELGNSVAGRPDRKDDQVLNEQKERRQQEENKRLQEQQMQLQQQMEKQQGRQKQEQLQQQQIPATRGDKERRPRNPGETDEARNINPPDDKTRVKSPRELNNKEENRAGQKNDQLRQQEANKQLQEQEIKQQQKEEQGRQQQEMQQRQKQDHQRQQDESAKQQDQAVKQKKKKQMEEEQQQKDKQPPPGAGG